MKEHLATAIGSQTLVGFTKQTFPAKRGNCFGVETANGTSEFRIVNFVVENLEELLSRGLCWPIRIVELDNRVAVINDERIPDDWYREDFCETCCPESLLPTPQILKHERDKLRGWRKVIKGENFDVVKITFGNRTLPPLDHIVELDI